MIPDYFTFIDCWDLRVNDRCPHKSVDLYFSEASWVDDPVFLPRIVWRNTALFPHQIYDYNRVPPCNLLLSTSHFWKRFVSTGRSNHLRLDCADFLKILLFDSPWGGIHYRSCELSQHSFQLESFLGSRF